MTYYISTPYTTPPPAELHHVRENQSYRYIYLFTVIMYKL